mmetsp:Transcript_104435/g.265077  ORF Transcript_104435/g.265077 Transcript_104435/m.265077 type:complete len:330 (+) Transcript_104435:353-1342(+)
MAPRRIHCSTTHSSVHPCEAPAKPSALLRLLRDRLGRRSRRFGPRFPSGGNVLAAKAAAKAVEGGGALAPGAAADVLRLRLAGAAALPGRTRGCAGGAAVEGLLVARCREGAAPRPQPVRQPASGLLRWSVGSRPQWSSILLRGEGRDRTAPAAAGQPRLPLVLEERSQHGARRRGAGARGARGARCARGARGGGSDGGAPRLRRGRLCRGGLREGGGDVVGDGGACVVIGLGLGAWWARQHICANGLCPKPRLLLGRLEEVTKHVTCVALLRRRAGGRSRVAILVIVQRRGPRQGGRWLAAPCACNNCVTASAEHRICAKLTSTSFPA